MKWERNIVLAILVFLPTVGSSGVGYSCVSKYEGGSKPDKAEINQILKDHETWITKIKKKTRSEDLCEVDLSKAYLNKANLSMANLWRANLSQAYLDEADLTGAYLDEADLTGAYLRGVNLTGANLSRANLTGANLSRANLTGANLSRANLTGANLSGVNLTGANLSGTDLDSTKLNNVNLTNSIFTNINLKETVYEPISAPHKAYLSGIKNLESVLFEEEKQSGLVLLRNNLKEVGLRKLERQATYAIEKGKTDHAFSKLDEEEDLVGYVSLWNKVSGRRLFFEYTAGYGLFPGQCLLILFSFIPLFALIYLFSIFRKQKQKQKRSRSLDTLFLSPDVLGQQKDGIYRLWVDDRVRKDLGSTEPELINAGFVKSIIYALYFSFLSAFHIGWRDINVGNWIARIQPREYTLRSTGWVRTVSGIQSLISIYLLAFWVLTQFGRPFG